MNFIEKLHNHCENKGCQLTLEDIENFIADKTATNIGFIDLVDTIYSYVSTNGYTETLTAFENKYYKFWGKRPKGK